MMPNPNVSFRAPVLLRKHLDARNPKDDVKNSGAIVRRDVERWYEELTRALGQLKLQPAEAVLLLGVVGTSELSPADTAHYLGTLVANDNTEGYGHVRHHLVQKIAAWDTMTRWAVVDAAERYVIFQRRNPTATIGMALHAVGLHSYEVTLEELKALESTTAAPPAALEPLKGE